MDKSRKRVIAASVAVLTAFSASASMFSTANEYEAEDDDGSAYGLYALTPKQDLSANAPDLVAFTGVEYKDASGSVRSAVVSGSELDSVSREGYKTFFSEEALSSEQLSEMYPEFELLDSCVELRSASGEKQGSGASEANFAGGTADYVLVASDSEQYTGEKEYHVGVVPKTENGGNLFVMKPEGRTVDFNSELGDVYTIALFNTGDEALENVTVELEEAHNVAIANAQELANATIDPYITENGDVGSAQLVTLVREGDGEVSGRVRISEAGRYTYDIPLSGYAGQREFYNTTQDSTPGAFTAVKYVPYSLYVDTLDINSDGQVNSSSTVTVEGLSNGFSYDPATYEIYGVPKRSGRETFTVTVNYSDGDGRIQTKTRSYTINVKNNTNSNVFNATDEGYELKKPIGEEVAPNDFVREYYTYPNFAEINYMYNITGGTTQTGGGGNKPTTSGQYSSDVVNGVKNIKVYGAIPGAEYFIGDEQGNILYSWVSSGSDDLQAIGSYLEPNKVYYLITKSIPDLSDYDLSIYRNTVGIAEGSTDYAQWLQPDDGRVKVNGVISDPIFEGSYRRARFVTAPLTREKYASENPTTNADPSTVPAATGIKSIKFYGCDGAKYILGDTKGNVLLSWVSDSTNPAPIGQFMEPDKEYYVVLKTLPNYFDSIGWTEYFDPEEYLTITGRHNDSGYPYTDSDRIYDSRDYVQWTKIKLSAAAIAASQLESHQNNAAAPAGTYESNARNAGNADEFESVNEDEDAVGFYPDVQFSSSVAGIKFFVGDQNGHILHEWVSNGTDSEQIGRYLAPLSLIYYIGIESRNLAEGVHIDNNLKTEIAGVDDYFNVEKIGEQRLRWLAERRSNTPLEEIKGLIGTTGTPYDYYSPESSYFPEDYEYPEGLSASTDFPVWYVLFPKTEQNNTENEIGTFAISTAAITGSGDQSDNNRYMYNNRVKDYNGGGGDVSNTPVDNRGKFLGDAIDVTDELMISVGEFSEYRKLYLNGKLLVNGKDYTAKRGSTEITVKSQALIDNVVQGENTIAAEFRTSDTHANELKVTSQNFRVELVEMNISDGLSYLDGLGGGDGSRLSDQEREIAAELNERLGAAQSADGTTVSPTDAGTKTDENTESGRVVNYALSAVLLIGSLGTLAYTRKKKQ